MRLETLQEEIMELGVPENKIEKFRIIYSDPPWKYGSKTRLNNSTGRQIKKLSEHYFSMTTEEICKLPVEQITEKDACCFLWFTSAFGEDAYKVMRSWGFRPIKIIFVWEKMTKNWKTCQNIGPWTMGNYEYVLFGTKGTMQKYKQKNNLSEKVCALRKNHSQKPDEVRDLIVKLFGDLPRVELFARKQTPGWLCLGEEINNKNIKEELWNLANGMSGL